MKRILVIFALLLLLWSTTSAVSATPKNLNYVAKIVYAEGASFRGSPTSTVPKGRQYCTADKSMATDADKQEAFTEMAKVVLARKACGLTVGDGVGTAKPKDGSTEKGPGAKSSWKMAVTAESEAQAWWDKLKDKEKKDQCDAGYLYFYHRCYCCEPNEEDSGRNGESFSENPNDFEGYAEEMRDCEQNQNDKGCPTSGHVQAATYKKVPCPGCRFFEEPTFWANKDEAPRTVYGENMNDTLSKCWTEVIFLGGGR